MAAPKIDINLSAFLDKGVTTTETLQVDHQTGATVAGAVHGLLVETRAGFKEARAKVKKERREAEQAAAQLDALEFRAAGVYPRLYNEFKAESWRLKSGPEVASRQFDAKLSKVIGDVTPAKFAELGVARTIEQIVDTAEYGEELLGADHADVQEAYAVHAELEQARNHSDAEASDLQMAMTELMAARDEVKRNYSAARKMLQGVLELDDYDDIHSFLPPLSSIYHSSGASTEGEEEPEPTPEPATDPA